MIAAMTLLVMLLLFGLLQTYYLGNYNLKLQYAASTAARRVCANKWWLGVERPDWEADQPQAEAAATQAINAELAGMGLSKVSKVTFTYSNSLLRRKEITLARVEFDVDVLKMPRAGFLPGKITLHAIGVSSDAEHAITKHGQAFMHVTDPNTKMERGIRIPAYNATVGEETPAHPTWLNAGKAVPNYPLAYLQLKCKTDGSELTKQKEVGNQAQITDRASW